MWYEVWSLGVRRASSCVFTLLKYHPKTHDKASPVQVGGGKAAMKQGAKVLWPTPAANITS